MSLFFLSGPWSLLRGFHRDSVKFSEDITRLNVFEKVEFWSFTWKRRKDLSRSSDEKVWGTLNTLENNHQLFDVSIHTLRMGKVLSKSVSLYSTSSTLYKS